VRRLGAEDCVKMVNVHVAFSYRAQNWTHHFRIDSGATILQLKELMVSPTGTKEDIDSIELRQLGQRVPDWEVLLDDATLDFELLLAEEGGKLAAEDAQSKGSFGPGRQKLQFMRKEPKPQQEPAVATAPLQAAAPVVAAPSTAPANSAGAAAAPTEARSLQWEVVGGVGKGGILVRSGQDLRSPAVDARLATGAIVEQLELVGERLRYRLVRGSGPTDGWISTRITGKDLVRPA